MSTPVELIKFQNVIIERWRVLLALFGVLLMFSGISLYHGLQTKYEYKDVVVSTYTQHGDYTYNAPVALANPLYPVGTVLESGRPAYFLNVAPALDMRFAYRIDSSDSVNVGGTIQTLVVASGTVKDGDNQTTYWQKEFAVKSSSFTLTDPSPIETSFSVNIPEIQAMVKGISEQLNYTDETSLTVVNRVAYGGMINGVEVNNVTDYTLPITVNNAYYQVPTTGLINSDTTNVTQFSSVAKAPTTQTLATPSIAMIICAIVCMCAVIMHKSGKKVEPACLAILEKEQKDAEFKDSVSLGKMPENHPFTPVAINSLKGLVDGAVDMNSRVIFDKDIKTYFTISNGVIYTFIDTIVEEPQSTQSAEIPDNKKEEEDLNCFHGKDASPMYEIKKRIKLI
jgi:hypothetical protein